MYPKKISSFNHTMYSKAESKDSEKRLIEKLAITLKLKYYNFFKKNNYSVKQMISDLTEEVKNSHSSKANFDRFLNYIEKAILAKVSRGLTKKTKSTTDINNRIDNKTCNENEGRSSALLVNDKSEYRSEGRIIPKRRKLVEENSIKKQDEWCKIALYYNQLHNEELIRAKEVEKEKKLKLRAYLSAQLNEKTKSAEKIRENEDKYLKEKEAVLKQYDDKEREKINEYKRKVSKENEARDRIKTESLKFRERIRINELIEDKKFVENNNRKLVEEELKIKTKKDQEKETYRRIIKENEFNLKIKREAKVKEVQDNKKYVLDMMKLLEKQEEDREHERVSRLDKIRKSVEKNSNYIKVDEKAMNLLEEKEYLKQLEEKDKKEEIKEKNDKIRLIQLNEENKKVLDNQIQEKRKMAQTMRDLDRTYGKSIMNDIKLYKEENVRKSQKEHEKLNLYKVELENQIMAKTNYKESFMDDKERLYNKSILEKINDKINKI
jgi:hypothetical protein